MLQVNDDVADVVDARYKYPVVLCDKVIPDHKCIIGLKWECWLDSGIHRLVLVASCRVCGVIATCDDHRTDVGYSIRLGCSRALGALVLDLKAVKLVLASVAGLLLLLVHLGVCRRVCFFWLVVLVMLWFYCSVL